MFDWCQNLQPHDNHELVFSHPIPYQPAPYSLNPYPKFAMTATKKPRTLQTDTKPGIKTHFSKSIKTHRSTQVTLASEPARKLVDGCTQTSRLMVNQSKTAQTSYTTAVDFFPPKPQKESNDQLQRIRYSPMSLRFSQQQYADPKIQVSKDTKASNCLIQTKYRNQFSASVSNLKNIESYHITQPLQLQPTDHYNSDRPYSHTLYTDRQNDEVAVEQPIYPTQQGSTSITQCERPTLKSIYSQSIRNVESEYKLTDKKQYDQRYRQTPNRKILFRDRETIVSRENESRMEEQSYRVDESILCQPTVRELFTPVGQRHVCGGYVLALARENLTGMVVSMTEVSTSEMGKIAEELFIYQELNAQGKGVEGVLQLYQTQMDRGCYLLIKQSFTGTLRECLERRGVAAVARVLDQLQTNLQRLQGMGFYLRESVGVDDVVMVYEEAKIHRLGLFGLAGEGREISLMMNWLKLEMLELCSFA